MSRLYKQSLSQTAEALGATNVIANGEQLSGADLAQVMLAARAGVAANVTAAGLKQIGLAAAFTGNPANASLTGADLEYSAAITAD